MQLALPTLGCLQQFSVCLQHLIVDLTQLFARSLLVQYIVNFDLGLDCLDLVELLLLEHLDLVHLPPAAALKAGLAATEDRTDTHQSGKKHAHTDVVNIRCLRSPLKSLILEASCTICLIFLTLHSSMLCLLYPL